MGSVFSEIYNLLGINLFEGVISIIGGLYAIVTIIYNLFNSRFQISFLNTRKIQKYSLYEYYYLYLWYQFLTLLINPIIALIIFFSLAKLLSMITFPIAMQFILLAEFYIIIIAYIHGSQLRLLKRYKHKLNTIATSLDEKERELIRPKNISMRLYTVIMFNFYLIWILLAIFLSVEVTKSTDLAKEYIIVEFFVYVISIFLSLLRVLSYEKKWRIKSKIIIKVDYKSDFNCFSTIVLKKDFSFKIENDNIIIYYPGDISLYTIKQDKLINLNVGYRVEYENTNSN